MNWCEFRYSACGPFTKSKERVQKLKKQETPDTSIIYQNELDKVYFQHSMAYGAYKDLPRTASDKVLRDKAFGVASNPQYDGY